VIDKPTENAHRAADIDAVGCSVEIYLRLVERAWCAKQHATYRWLAIDVSRRQAAPREPAHAPSSAAKPRSRDFEARVIALQARGDHGR
jgi:hypothetical protein